MTDPQPQLGPFRLAEQLGEGGMGTVFRATHNRTGVDVALKVVRNDGGKQFKRQFHREVQAHAALVHPGIVYLFDYGEISEEAAGGCDEFTVGSPWVAMQLADGGTVRDLMPVADWQTVRSILAQTLDALAYAHARDVVHRDLKPENLLVFETDGDRRIKLADFGIAHALDDIDDRETNELEVTAGTPLYMAPEQIRGRWRDYGPWTDIYSLGCIAYRLVCGRPPFVADNPVTLTVRHCTEERPRLEPQFAVPDGLEAWIHQAMAVDYPTRFRRAADAARALPVGDDVPSTPVESDEQNFETMETIPADDAPTEVAPTKTTTLPPTEILSDHSGPPTAPSTSPSTLRSDGSATSPATGKESAPSSPDESLQTSSPATNGSGGSGPTPHGGGSPQTTTSSPATNGSGGSGPTPHGGGSMGASRTTERLDDLPDWRTDELHELPTPLVGTGLGLFGLRETPFVDRNDERDAIWKRLDDVVTDGAFRVVLLTGQSGTGKTRLARWIARRVDEIGAAGVVRANHSPGANSRTDGLGGLVLRAVHGWRLQRGEFHDHLLEMLPPLEQGPDLREADARALTELVYPTDPSEQHVDGPRYEFDGPRHKYVVMSRFLRRINLRWPPLVWLDDLQWGPDSTGLVHHLLATSSRPPGLIVATVRSEATADNTRFTRQLESIEEHPESDRIDLTPLEPGDHRRFIDRLLSLEPDLAERIADRTEGNPLFAHQLIGELVATDSLEVGTDGFELTESTELTVPDDIHEMWLTRWRRLLEKSFPERADVVGKTIELAAILNRQVDDGEWRAACSQAGLQVPQGLVDTLVERGLAEHTEDGWSFAHGMFVDSLVRYAREARRAADHHRHCARMLERRYPDRPRQTARRRAEHFIASGDLDQALEPLLQEVRRLKPLGDHRRRRRLLQRRQRIIDRLDLDATARPRLENEFELASANYDIGDLGSFEPFQQLADKCRAAGWWELTARSLRLAAIIETNTEDPRSAHETFEDALDAANRTDNRELRGKIRISMGRQRLKFPESTLPADCDYAGLALKTLPDSANYLRLRAQELRAWETISEGDWEVAKPAIETLFEESERLGFLTIQSSAANALGDIARFQANPDEARRHYRHALTVAREHRVFPLLVATRVNLAQTEVLAGRFDQVDHHLETLQRHLDEAQKMSLHRRLIQCVEVARAAGLQNWSTLDEHLQSFTDWSEEGPLERDHGWLLELAADYALEAGETTRAHRMLEVARDIWRHFDDDEAIDRIEQQLP